ncbi:hypothetical protein H8356DRAFT_995522 [Neocallimastix lanati (nom. inval.)]|uniref:Uncharacterized protein n=1 Tax=Neocallimastix californiae TaxID=1754190 RepID=A0A1Y2C067_9FUNG|nr:hypothetical protein H8356DRAFT_995522 [Neocallimastix sp. JGI-2020a]ORY39705.1 hypothetical protein LY90DRAFT_672386 [Neocallimastix californiae]|eukprot:ORY39705.1 hypothetical protein LY90DRAFT_672386 [Neocallimastix californiae]
MLRYNFDRKPIKGAMRRSKKQQINNYINKAENESSSSQLKNIPLKNENFIENEDYDEIPYQNKIEKHIPKSWKESWMRPLNQNIIYEDFESSTEEKIRTDTKSKRRESRKSSYLADMLITAY